jgi:hypothetical protein
MFTYILIRVLFLILYLKQESLETFLKNDKTAYQYLFSFKHNIFIVYQYFYFTFVPSI